MLASSALKVAVVVLILLGAIDPAVIEHADQASAMLNDWLVNIVPIDKGAAPGVIGWIAEHVYHWCNGVASVFAVIQLSIVGMALRLNLGRRFHLEACLLLTVIGSCAWLCGAFFATDAVCLTGKAVIAFGHWTKSANEARVSIVHFLRLRRRKNRKIAVGRQ